MVWWDMWTNTSASMIELFLCRFLFIFIFILNNNSFPVYKCYFNVICWFPDRFCLQYIIWLVRELWANEFVNLLLSYSAHLLLVFNSIRSWLSFSYHTFNCPFYCTKGGTCYCIYWAVSCSMVELFYAIFIFHASKVICYTESGFPLPSLEG